MIHGTGIDIIEIERIQKAIDRWGDNFLKHVFTNDEMAYAKKKKFPTQHYAARFAAKEAVFKAVGDNPKLSWKDIEVFNDEFGKPCCVLKDPSFNNKIFLSLTHTHNYAVASAIITS